MPATVFTFTFLEYLKGARKKKRRDVSLEDAEKENRNGHAKSEPDAEIEIGKEVVSRDGFFPTWVQTPPRKDRSRDFKIRITFSKNSVERAEFFPVFIPGDVEDTYAPSLRTNGKYLLELAEGQEGILCVLENENGLLYFTLLDLWEPTHITSVSAESWQEIFEHFFRSLRYGAAVEKFFRGEREQARKRAEEERKRTEEEGRKKTIAQKLSEKLGILRRSIGY